MAALPPLPHSHSPPPCLPLPSSSSSPSTAPYPLSLPPSPHHPPFPISLILPQPQPTPNPHTWTDPGPVAALLLPARRIVGPFRERPPVRLRRWEGGREKWEGGGGMSRRSQGRGGLEGVGVREERGAKEGSGVWELGGRGRGGGGTRMSPNPCVRTPSLSHHILQPPLLSPFVFLHTSPTTTTTTTSTWNPPLPSPLGGSGSLTLHPSLLSPVSAPLHPP
jgi:hypothetical protein